MNLFGLWLRHRHSQAEVVVWESVIMWLMRIWSNTHWSWSTSKKHNRPNPTPMAVGQQSASHVFSKPPDLHFSRLHSIRKMSIFDLDRDIVDELGPWAVSALASASLLSSIDGGWRRLTVRRPQLNYQNQSRYEPMHWWTYGKWRLCSV